MKLPLTFKRKNRNCRFMWQLSRSHHEQNSADFFPTINICSLPLLFADISCMESVAVRWMINGDHKMQSNFSFPFLGCLKREKDPSGRVDRARVEVS